MAVYTVCHIFAAPGLRVFQVEELPMHCVSLLVYGCHDYCKSAIQPSVSAPLAREGSDGLLRWIEEG